MKKYEYRLVVFKSLRDEIRATNPAFKNLSEMEMMQKVLDRIGEEGWNILTVEKGDSVLQREKS